VVRVDGRDEPGAQNAVRHALNEFGRIDVLFNIGGHRRLGNFEASTTRDIEEVVSANLFEVIYAMRTVLPAMRGQGYGRIINISSVAGLVGLARCSAYSAATFAVEGLSQAVAREVEPFGIRITTIALGLSGFGPHKHRDTDDKDRPLDDSSNISLGYGLYAHADAERLSYVLLTISQMKDPPRQFVADGDSLEMYKPVLIRQLDDLSTNEALSRSMSEPILIEQFAAMSAGPPLTIDRGFRPAPVAQTQLGFPDETAIMPLLRRGS